MRLPERIEGEGLLLRRWRVEDAELLGAAVAESVEHLLPWMPWAHQEPQTVEEKTELIKRFRANFDSGDNFTCGIFSADEAQVLGGTGLHPRIGPGGLEIGYWIRASAGVPRKLGFVEEATLRRRLPAWETGPLRDVTIFTMFREDCDRGIAPGIRAFDARGERLL